MSFSKEDLLKALKDNGINNLDDLANAASEKASAAKTVEFEFVVHKNFAVSS